MTIGILYIGLGKYLDFFKDFHLTCEKYFVQEVRKEYYVFTDQPNKQFLLNNSNIKVIQQKDLGWPGNTLFRFQMFLTIENQLAKHDYLFFFNGNTLFKKKISSNEIIPQADDSYLVGLSWTNVYTDKNLFPYERNPKSLACIPSGSGNYYFQGGLNGGRTKEYLDLIHNCNDAIEKDLSNKIIACSHDESHINKYLLNRKIKVLNSSYGCPEERDFSSNPKIIFRDKNKHLGENYVNKMKGRKSGNIIKKILSKVKNIILHPKKIEVIYLQGGLGNQMFQYAFYLNRKNKGNNITYDTTLIDLQNQHNGYELERIFKIKSKTSPFRILFYKLINGILYKNSSNIIFKILEWWSKHLGLKIIKDTEPSIYFNKFDLKQINVFLGYWQTEKYFSNNIDLKQIFSFDENLLSDMTRNVLLQIEKCNSVSIHIRRGDYLLNNPLYGNICTLEYYKKSIEYIKKTVSNSIFYIFSDDIEWVKENINLSDAIYINHNKETDSWQDMFLMSRCKHNIIANSSFSWWGAYLNDNPDKIIISPSKFINSTSEQHIISDSFVKIKV